MGDELECSMILAGGYVRSTFFCLREFFWISNCTVDFLLLFIYIKN